MFTEEEWYALLAKLRQLTEEDKLAWEISQGGVYTEINDVTYLLTSRDGDDQAPYVLSVRLGTERDWREIDALVSVGGPERAAVPGTLVQPLEALARRMALGGPKLARRLLAELEKIDPTSPPSYGATPPTWRPVDPDEELPF